MTQEQREILASMKDTQYGIALKALLEECLQELGDVTKCTSWDDTLGRKHAKEFIKRTFTFLEKPEPSKGQRTMYT